MESVILAAGLGSRLTPLTKNKPKCLVKIAGVPIIEHQIKAMKASGINRIYIIAGYFFDDIKKFILESFDIEIILVNNLDYLTTNNMYSLNLLKKKLYNKKFILCNGDVIYDKKIISTVVESSLKDLIACDSERFDQESMKIILNDLGFVKGISKKYKKENSFASSMDLYKFSEISSKLLFDAIETKLNENSKNFWVEVAIDELCKNKFNFFRPLDLPGKRWYEIDDCHDWLNAEQLFSDFDLKKYDTFFFDIDGTLSSQGELFDKSTHLLDKLTKKNKKIFLVTNNTSKSSYEIKKYLQNFGINTNKCKIITPINGVIHYLKKHNIDKIYSVGTSSFKMEMEKNGIIHSEKAALQVVISYDVELTYEKLKVACDFINQGVPYILTHPDITYPGRNGPIPDAGSISFLIQMTTQKKPSYVFGKPSDSMLQNIFNSGLVKREKSLFIGDNLSTDKILANNMNIDFVCTLTGVTRLNDLQKLTKYQWPKYIIKSISDLYEKDLIPLPL